LRKLPCPAALVPEAMSESKDKGRGGMCCPEIQAAPFIMAGQGYVCLLVGGSVGLHNLCCSCCPHQTCCMRWATSPTMMYLSFISFSTCLRELFHKIIHLMVGMIINYKLLKIGQEQISHQFQFGQHYLHTNCKALLAGRGHIMVVMYLITTCL
jgi:hypothetical protein